MWLAAAGVPARGGGGHRGRHGRQRARRARLPAGVRAASAYLQQVTRQESLCSYAPKCTPTMVRSRQSGR